MSQRTRRRRPMIANGGMAAWTDMQPTSSVGPPVLCVHYELRSVGRGAAAAHRVRGLLQVPMYLAKERGAEGAGARRAIGRRRKRRDWSEHGTCADIAGTGGMSGRGQSGAPKLLESHGYAERFARIGSRPTVYRALNGAVGRMDSTRLLLTPRRSKHPSRPHFHGIILCKGRGDQDPLRRGAGRACCRKGFETLKRNWEGRIRGS